MSDILPELQSLHSINQVSHHSGIRRVQNLSTPCHPPLSIQENLPSWQNRRRHPDTVLAQLDVHLQIISTADQILQWNAELAERLQLLAVVSSELQVVASVLHNEHHVETIVSRLAAEPELAVVTHFSFGEQMVGEGD